MGWLWAILCNLVAAFLFGPIKRLTGSAWSCLHSLFRHACWWRKRREELRRLEEELGVLRDYQEQVRTVVPWLGPLFDIRGEDTGEVVRGLVALSRIVAGCGDAHAQLIVFEIDKLNLASSPVAEIRRKAFQVRGAAASCAPADSYPSLWTTLVETLDPLLASDNAEVSHAACVELCEDAERLSRENSPLLTHLRARIHSLLVRCLSTDMPEVPKIHLIEAIAALKSDTTALKKAFHLAMEAALLAPDTLGGSLVSLLGRLGSTAFDVNHDDLIRLMRTEAFFDHHQAIYDEHLVPTVFAPFDRGHVKGRIWRRSLVSNVRMSCQPLEGQSQGRCQCRVRQLSFGGMWCPECTRPFSLPLGQVELTVEAGDTATNIMCRLCRVAPAHDNHPPRGRGVKIEEYEEGHRERMFQYLATMARAGAQP